MAWKTESLGSYYTRAAVAAVDLGEEIVSDLSDYATKKTILHTPMSNVATHTAGRPPGTLRSSVEKSRIKFIHGFIVGGVESHDPVAEDVEYGTGLWGPRGQKYIIKPVTHRMLRFFVQNAHHKFNDQGIEQVMSGSKPASALFGPGWINVPVVHHPGSPGQHMFLKGIMDTELVAVKIMEKRMRVFERELRSVRAGGVVVPATLAMRAARGGSPKWGRGR